MRKKWKQWQSLFSWTQNHCGQWLQKKLKTLAPWKKSNDKPRQCIKKQRHHFFLTRVQIVKAMIFPVVMYGCESWPIKKTDDWRIDAFKLWCWRRLLRFPWTARRSNPSILKEINSKYSLEGLMLKLTSQYYDLMWWADSWEKTLMLWKTAGRRRLSLYGQARTVTALWKYFQVSVQWASSFWKAIFP